MLIILPERTVRGVGRRAVQFGFGITGTPGVAVNIESSGDLSQFYRGHVR
jgi:hypothetical protein